jgi:hypothetical protein
MKKQTEVALRNTGRYCMEQREWVGFSDLPWMVPQIFNLTT